jgi:hypothetical protein
MSRMTSRAFVAGMLSIAVLGAWSACAGADPYPQERRSFMMGGNLGGGTAAVSASGGGMSVSTSREAGVAGNFRFGWGVSPYVTLGFESNAWSKSEGGTTVNFGVGAFTATYYPNPAQGFYMRAGVGGGTQKLMFTENNVSAIATENGVGFTGGVGYEMRLGQKWSLGPALDYGYTSVDVPGGSISANYVNFTAAFNWYFQ